MNKKNIGLLTAMLTYSMQNSYPLNKYYENGMGFNKLQKPKAYKLTKHQKVLARYWLGKKSTRQGVRGVIMKLNTLIKLPDGRIGTICYNHLDGCGGIWGEHTFEMPECGFGDLPEPEFMLRNKDLQGRVGCEKSECVGEEYEIIEPEKRI